jgi:hypothetical protein
MATRTYGTVSPERQTAMSGLEFVKGLASGMLPLNTIAQTWAMTWWKPKAVASPSRWHQQAEGRVTDAKGQLLAHGTTTCLIFPS